MLKIFLGDEPYLLDSAEKLFLEKASVEDVVTSTEYCMVREHLQTISLFGKKGAKVHLSALKELDVPEFWEDYASLKSDPDTILLVKASSYDTRTSVYKNLVADKDKIVSFYDKSILKSGLSKHLRQTAANYGATFTEDALAVMEELSNYGESDISYYDLVGDIKNLASISSTITTSMVEEVVYKQEMANCFALLGMIQRKDTEALRRQVALLSGNEIGAMSALLREYRIHYKYLAGIDTQKSKATCSKQEAVDAIDILTEGITAIKNSGISKDIIFLECLYKLV